MGPTTEKHNFDQHVTATLQSLKNDLKKFNTKCQNFKMQMKNLDNTSLKEKHDEIKEIAKENITNILKWCKDLQDKFNQESKISQRKKTTSVTEKANELSNIKQIASYSRYYYKFIANQRFNRELHSIMGTTTIISKIGLTVGSISAIATVYLFANSIMIQQSPSHDISNRSISTNYIPFTICLTIASFIIPPAINRIVDHSFNLITNALGAYLNGKHHIKIQPI